MKKSLPLHGVAAACFAVLVGFTAGLIGHQLGNTKGAQIISQTLNFARLSGPVSTAAQPDFSGTDNYLPDVCQQGVYQWPTSRLPIKVYISTGANVPGYRPNFPGMIRESFNTWASASNNKISWKEVSDRSAADITVDWTTQVKELPQGTEAGETNALTRLNSSTGRGIIFGARMHFLTQLNGVDFGDTEMRRTCLHEAGHALGLQGHSPLAKDVMYYAISKRQLPELSSRDMATMARLYDDAPASDAIALGSR